MYQLSLLEKNFDKLIEKINEPSWMTQTRREAFEKYAALPLEASALYSKYSNANKLIPDNVFFVKILKFSNTICQKILKKRESLLQISYRQ